jgi:starch synthase (maltosyl-transferring)
MSPPRICDLGVAPKHLRASDARARALGFDYLATDNAVPLADCELPVIAGVDLSETSTTDPFVVAHPDWFAIKRTDDPGFVVDPRDPSQIEGKAVARLYTAHDEFRSHWQQSLAVLFASGYRGLRLRHPQRLPAALWRSLIADAKMADRELIFIADIMGLTCKELASLHGCGFDYCLSSPALWNLQSPSLVEEYEAASRIAPVLASVAVDRISIPAAENERCARYAVAAIAGSGVWMPFEFASGCDIDVCIRSTNAIVASDEIVAASGALSRQGDTLIRTLEVDQRTAKGALLAILNPRDLTSPSPGAVEDWELPEATTLAPHEVRLFRVRRRAPILREDPTLDPKRPRVVITNISPSVDNGRYPTKRIVGDAVVVEADIFADGHPLLAAELVHRDQRVPMRLVQNDRWHAAFVVDRVGRHEFVIDAWINQYGGFARDLAKKQEAGRDITLDLREGEASVRHALGVSTSDPAVLLAPETVEAMRRLDARRFLARSATYSIDVDRIGARFASWYELFPRSQTDDEAHHGTFRDVIARLPAIRTMGFDVLYFPPIHPIGRTNRKGRNNALSAGPNDPGSVYAIGSSEGGHDAIHPMLGTLDDFRALITAARAEGLEIALDFAVQCSPDHPWLKEHPGWFDWRADGSIKYAENPPKLYEDIVNVDFYAKDAIPGLWTALRDTVRFWAGEGVRIFRVDNPHTKPFAFWQWLIESIRASDPDVIFLAEAFTRPKIMDHLAKIGFTQSYTYFTWRNTKEELTRYLQELNEAPVRDFFRPHFFVNTPDINPQFLQTSGRPGFLIRAALAATLSGLWGIYSGFELCEAAALHGREEYLDSEKYQIRPRDWNAPANINTEIAILNRLRKAHPALQTHLGVTFYNAFNPSVLYYGKHVPGEASRILVTVSLDPHTAQACDFEIPLWEWGLPDSGALFVEDLLTGQNFVWHGKIQHVRLELDGPYRIWRVCPAEDQ